MKLGPLKRSVAFLAAREVTDGSDVWERAITTSTCDFSPILPLISYTSLARLRGCKLNVRSVVFYRSPLNRQNLEASAPPVDWEIKGRLGRSGGELEMNGVPDAVAQLRRS